MTQGQATERFLKGLDLSFCEMDKVDVEYLKDVHWERWEELEWRIEGLEGRSFWAA